MRYVIGCDIGTQSLKAVLVSSDGALLGEASAAYDVAYPQPAWAEQAPALWLAALEQALAGLRAQTPFAPADVAALALAAQVDGLVAVDAAGRPLRDAIIWMDRRATAQCRAVDADPARLLAISGLNLDPSHVAPKIAWMADHEPALFERARHFLLPGSYAALALTGELGVDFSNASSTLLLDVRSRAWSPELCARFGVDPAVLAPLLPSTAALGRLRPAIAKRLGLSPRTLVAAGCGDEHAACLGAGVLAPGLVCDIAGTAEPVCAASPLPLFDPDGLVETHCHADPQTWLIENPGFVSGANLRWFRDTFAPDLAGAAVAQGLSTYELLTAAAAEAPPGADGLLMLPCLMGAMTPTWNAAARGVFSGFTLAHGRPHFARAVLEASAYAVRDITDRMAAIGLAPREIRAVGGGARSRLWNQIKADVTGLPLALPHTAETTALGAAMVALVAAGCFPTLAAAADAIVRVETRVEPRPSEHARYQEHYARYRATYAALLPVWQAPETSGGAP